MFRRRRVSLSDILATRLPAEPIDGPDLVELLRRNILVFEAMREVEALDAAIREQMA